MSDIVGPTDSQGCLIFQDVVAPTAQQTLGSAGIKFSVCLR